MSNVLILDPAPIASVAASRGLAAASLLTYDPKEVWLDVATGPVAIDIDLGIARPIDTIFLGYVQPPAVDATWSISGGLADYTSFGIKVAGPLRAIDGVARQPATSHALWVGAPVAVRYIRITVSQPAGFSPLSVGVVMVGSAVVPDLGREWGAGRRPIDTGSVTSLPSGGFQIVKGARKRAYSWTFGDLTDDEVERIEAIALDLGGSQPGLVVEDPAATTGQVNRIHYGLFTWREFERRNRQRTRWEMSIEEWV